MGEGGHGPFLKVTHQTMATKGGKNFVFVVGGARSGKSFFALKLAGSSTPTGKRAYIATAEALDSEMAERIEEHKKTRGEGWITIEAPLEVEKAVTGDRGFAVILIDCLTLWLSNLMGEGYEDGEVLKGAESLASACAKSGALVIAVSNEVGLGLVPENPMARRFRDLAGRANQFFSDKADEVYLVTAGIPLKIK